MEKAANAGGSAPALEQSGGAGGFVNRQRRPKMSKERAREIDAAIDKWCGWVDGEDSDDEKPIASWAFQTTPRKRRPPSAEETPKKRRWRREVLRRWDPIEQWSD